MGIFVAILLGSMTFLMASGSESMCCKKKVVGGVAYTLIEVDHEASDFSCKNDCIYTTIDGGRYCFRVGDMESTCVPEEEILFMGGSNETAEFRNTVGVYPGNPCHYSTDPIPHDLNGAAAAYRGNTILMCGGNTGTKSNECYKIEKDGLRPAGPSMNTARYAFTMNSVGANLVVTGGFDGEFSINSVEILEHGATNWTPQSYELDPPRGFHCGVTISTKSVMLIGGWVDPDSEKLNTTEEMDITTGAMTPYDDLPVAVSGQACTLYNKEIWVSGGKTMDNYITSVYSLDYSNSSNKWKTRPNMKYAREGFAMFVLNGILTVYSGIGPGEFYIESFVDGDWESRSITSSRRGTAYVKIQCSRC